MRSPYNLAAGKRRYDVTDNRVFDMDPPSGGVLYIAGARTEALAAQIADALELVDRMRNHQ